MLTNVASLASASRRTSAEEISNGILADTAQSTGAGRTLVHVDAAVRSREPRSAFAAEPVDTVDAMASVVARLVAAIVHI